MSETFKSIPHDNAFDVLRNGHGVILTEFETARLATALQGVQAIAAVLQRREIDVELGEGCINALTFGTNVAQGLIAALATCAKYAEGIVDTGGLMGARAEHGSKAYEVLKGARFDVMQAKREEAKP